MSNFRRASVMVVLLVGMGALVRAHAQAATSVLGPTICVRAGTPGSSGLEYTSTGVTNLTGGQTDVICSLFRDNTTNTNGMQDLEVSVTDPSPAPGGVICEASSWDRNGLIKKKASRSNTVTGNQVLDWGGSVNVSVSRGFYSMRCTLPAGATLRSIFYTEP